MNFKINMQNDQEYSFNQFLICLKFLFHESYFISCCAVDGDDVGFPPYPLLPDELLPVVRKFKFSLLTMKNTFIIIIPFFARYFP